MESCPGTWSTIEIAGKAADIFEPTTPHPDSRCVLHLHGHGLTTLKDNPAFSAELEKHGLRTICPHGERSWWGDRVCPEFDSALTPVRYLLDHVIPWIESNWGITPPQVALMGISMGGQGVLRLGFQHARKFPIVAAISPAVDFHNWYGQGLPLDDMYSNREATRQDTATLAVRPLDWPRHQLIICDPTDDAWIEGVERLVSKLSSSGIPFEMDLKTSHGGHSWDYFDHMAPFVIQFVAERLTLEAARV